MATLDFIKELFSRGRDVSDFLTFNRAKAIKWQRRTLTKMLYKARNTEFGKTYDFEKILISNDVKAEFAANVPIGNYSAMHPWWQREFNGETNITWPGNTQYFALSSGTSEGSSKYIPVTEEQLKYMRKASLRQLFAIAKTDVPKDFLTKDYLMIGGSTTLQYDGTSYSGDLSGITIKNVPQWFDRFSQPSHEIRAEKSWEKKLEMLVEAAPTYDVVMLAGGPAWIKIIIEKILLTYKLDNIHQIWPNFSVYIWGAVSLSPYRKQIDAMLGKPIKYFETYLASEGFLAFQTKEDTEGMRLVLRNGIYFEFLPFNAENFDETGEVRPGAVPLTLDEVEENVDYALLISTSAGAWRYLIGDTIAFTDLDACSIKITGRTKHYLSICGEHLSVENMTEAIKNTAEAFNTAFSEFSVRGLKHDGVFGHHWFIACNDAALDGSVVQKKLDEELGKVNDDYVVERKHVLTEMKVTLLPESVFLDWMQKEGKMNGQAKFPRVMNDKIYEDWQSFLQQSARN